MGEGELLVAIAKIGAIVFVVGSLLSTYGLRLYQPRPSVLDGTWTAPERVQA